MLNVVAAQEARRIILSCVEKSDASEKTELYNACGKTTAGNVISGENLPAFDRSGVDGFAVKASDTFGCSETLPAMLEFRGKILMGQAVDGVLSPGCCMEIPTGGMLPKGADAAVMVEFTEDMGDNFRYILKPVAPYENVSRTGDDCKSGSIAVQGGKRIGAKDIAVLAALGIAEVETVIPPIVGIISTGDEVIDFKEKPTASQIRDINSVMLYSCVTQVGCKAKAYPVVADDEALLLAAIKTAVNECDCVLISGGSSVGERDAVCRVLSSQGEIKFHGIAVKPGKPTMFALLGKTPVFGLPGHPAAAFFAFHSFVKPALRKILGSNEEDICIDAIAAQNIPSNHGRQELVTVSLSGKLAIPLFAKSGSVAVLSRADGYIVIDRNSEGVLKDEKVKVILL